MHKVRSWLYERMRWTLIKFHPLIHWLYSHFEMQADMLDIRKLKWDIVRSLPASSFRSPEGHIKGAHQSSSMGKVKVPGGHIFIFILLSAISIHAQGQKPDANYMRRLHRYKVLRFKLTKAQDNLNRKLQRDIDEYQGLADWLAKNQPQGKILDFDNELFLPNPAPIVPQPESKPESKPEPKKEDNPGA